MQLSVKVIQPTKDIVNVQLYRRLTTQLLNDTGRDIKAQMLAPTLTWETVKVSVKIERGPGSVLAYTENKIWMFLDEGTRERWAIVSPDFESKTTPRDLTAGSGYGKVLLRGKANLLRHGYGAQPGIEAREWLQLIHKQVAQEFPEAYNKIIMQVTT